MNGNQALNLNMETLRSLTSHCHKNQLERLCTELELEMATYSREITNYLQLLQAIKDGRNAMK